jgi:hypothetical protein
MRGRCGKIGHINGTPDGNVFLFVEDSACELNCGVPNSMKERVNWRFGTSRVTLMAGACFSRTQQKNELLGT